MAAAAACRGSASNGGDGPWSNRVLAADLKRTCSDLCKSKGFICNSHVSLHGLSKKATSYGQGIGTFYNYGCDGTGHGIDEIKGADKPVQSTSNYYHYCCCKK